LILYTLYIIIYPGEKMLRRIVEVNGNTLVIPELQNFQGRKIEVILKELSGNRKSTRNLKAFFGTLKTDEDALEFQKRMRAEWEDREILGSVRSKVLI
jgi:hypothetical protein